MMTVKRGLRVLSLVMGALLLGSACTLRQDVAFRVEEQYVTTAQFTAALESCSRVLGMSQSRIRADIFAFMLEGILFDKLADDLGVAYGEDEQLAYLQQTNAAAMADDPTCRPVGLGAVAFQFMAMEVDSDALMSAIASLDIEINPRYGSWDKESLQLGEGGSLSQLDPSRR